MRGRARRPLRHPRLSERVLAPDQAIGNREGIGDAHQALSRLYEHRGDLDAAFSHASVSAAGLDPLQDRRCAWPR